MKPTRKFVRGRDDSLFEEGLRQVRPQPVFIIGLHRSGTTFLYKTLTDVLPVASLTAYYVIDYDRILLHHCQGTDATAKRELDLMFQMWHMATRGIDDVALSQAMPEEYGWVLRRWAGAFFTNAKTAPLLGEICRKLQFITPSAQSVLLKNPWDTGHVGDLLAHFPDARFIFLQRDPVAIVNSQLRVAKHFGRDKNPYVNLLFRGIPWGRTWMRLQRAVRKVAGERLHSRIALGYILGNVMRELVRLEISWDAVPPCLRAALDYADLVSDPGGSLEKLAAFLGLPLRRDLIPEKRHPRDPALLPEVAAAEAGFRRRLRNRAVAQRPLADVRTPSPGVQA